MADFNLAIPIVLAHEGGYVSDPADPGGETKYGISKRAFPALNIAQLTVDDAKTIYRKFYWHYDAIDNQNVATKVFDLAVNCGAKPATKMLQQAVNNCSLWGATLTVDGLLGPKTFAAVNAADPVALLHEIKNEALAYYRALVVSNPALTKFLKGWETRALS